MYLEPTKSQTSGIATVFTRGQYGMERKSLPGH